MLSYWGYIYMHCNVSTEAVATDKENDSKGVKSSGTVADMRYNNKIECATLQRNWACTPGWHTVVCCSEQESQSLQLLRPYKTASQDAHKRLVMQF